MKRRAPAVFKIKVSSSFGGKLPVGDYANMSPSFFAEVELEADAANFLDVIEAEQKKLHSVCFKNFKLVADVAKVEKIKNDFKSFRFYKTEFGEYPSVSTVNEPEFKSWVSDEDLRICTSEGNIKHARIYHYIKTGKWVDPKELEGVANDLVVCQGLFFDDFDFPALLEKHPILDMKNGAPIYNHKDRLAGTPDFRGLYPYGGEKGARLAKTLFDAKRTPDKIKNFSQMGGYKTCEGLEDIEQFAILPIHPDNAQNFSKPIITTAVDKFVEIFLNKRRKFLEVYGI